MKTRFIDLKKTREQLDSIHFDENAPAIFAKTHEMALYLLDAFLKRGGRTICSAEAIDKLLRLDLDWQHRAQELVLQKMNGRDPQSYERIMEMKALMRRAVAYISAMAVADVAWD